MFNKIKYFFCYSRTILAARLMQLAGLIVSVHDFVLPYFIGQDWSPFISKIPPHLLPFLIISIGILFEWLRRVTKGSIADGKPKQEGLTEKEIIKNLNEHLDDNPDTAVQKLLNLDYDEKPIQEVAPAPKKVASVKPIVIKPATKPDTVQKPKENK